MTPDDPLSQERPGEQPKRDQPPNATARAAAVPINQWPLLIVVAGILAGLAVAFFGQWRIGSMVIGSSLLIGAVERLLLSRRDAGLLQVRSKAFDITVLLGMGTAIIALAILVPDRHA